MSTRLPYPRLRAWLAPLSKVFGAAVARRNRRFDAGHGVERLDVPVVSVGNLTVGGTGKTPLVAWIARHWLATGGRPAVVSRGYGSDAGVGPRLVSAGEGPLLPVARTGDEPRELARALPGVTIVVGSDRVRGARFAIERGADLIVLDDGFQHRRLARDLDLVLLDRSAPFGDGRLLPAGSLREPPASLARADLVLVTRLAEDEALPPALVSEIASHAPGVPVLRAGHRRTGFFRPDGSALAPPRRVVAFCAIADPAAFRRELEASGATVVGWAERRDHAAFDAATLAGLRETARAEDAVLVTTDKDLARTDVDDVAVLRIEAVVYDPDPLRTRLAALGRSA